tara:strand:+ start:107471 stop:110713 length:3243 start_codon:yes stop_codon:yes gene_type:complete
MLENGQFLLFDLENIPTKKWPKLDAFPLNIKSLNEHIVENIIKRDLTDTRNFTVITGFTSLSYLIDTFGNNDYNHIKNVVVALGFEPNVRGRKRYHIWPLEKEIKEYWLKEGLSILSGGSVINLIEKINEGWIKFYFYDKLHAKIYLYDNTAILGSSNFSLNGLTIQREANIRIKRVDEPLKYDDIELIAKNFIDESLPYDKITDLLKALIQEVDWKDALARAMSEILEGAWLEEYHTLMSKLNNTSLWPTQKRGLAQAMTILQKNNNVLIADPTGAGKTKLCSAIILALKNWLYETGRGNKDNSLIVCPPLVIEKWQNEFSDLSTVNNNQISTGILSNDRTTKKERAIKNLQQTSILAIDEAHNYLNINSKRSIAIRKNNADFKLLITATPINKKIDDLLTIVELLDVDNLNDESFLLFKELKSHPNLCKEANIKQLRSFISSFTLRRTKEVINNQIDFEPEKYKNALGDICRFPKQISKIYNTHETEKDIDIVHEIKELCDKIKGVTYLKSISKPKYELSSDEDTQSYFNQRLNASKALSIYMIRSRLRSSNMALLEHILGIEGVKNFKDFPVSKKQTNKIKVTEIDNLINKNKIPSINQIFKHVKKPIWLLDVREYLKVCNEEKDIYIQIAELTKKLSGERELGKAKHLIERSLRNKKIIAFDSSIITLNYLKFLIKNSSPKTNVLVATGSNKRESEEVLKKFHLKSNNTDTIIALCSDKMSEGVDLQLASSATLLDLPSVIRIVEQRFGHIDRMDTSHKEIELFWPNDSDAFSLKGDKRLIELNQIVSDMWGANFQPPEELKHKHFVSADKGIKEIIKEYENYILNDITWEGIEDSFQPILDLKNSKKGLISEYEYQQYKGSEASVKTKVSFLKTSKEWCFFAIKGNENRSPQWYFIEPGNDDKEIYTEFSEICNKLRQYISKKNERIKWNDKYLKRYLHILQNKEIELLPPKKRRALEVAEHVLKKKYNSKKEDLDKRMVIKKLIDLFHPKKKAIDFEAYAELWIDKLQPFLDEKRSRYKTSKRVYNLNSLKTSAEIKKINFTLEELKIILHNLPIYEKVDSKIASCIVGVPNEG